MASQCRKQRKQKNFGAIPTVLDIFFPIFYDSDFPLCIIFLIPASTSQLYSFWLFLRLLLRLFFLIYLSLSSPATSHLPFISVQVIFSFISPFIRFFSLTRTFNFTSTIHASHILIPFYLFVVSVSPLSPCYLPSAASPAPLNTPLLQPL